MSLTEPTDDPNTSEDDPGFGEGDSGSGDDPGSGEGDATGSGTGPSVSPADPGPPYLIADQFPGDSGPRPPLQMVRKSLLRV